MSEGVIAKRYARALFEIATEHNLINEIEQDVIAVNLAIQSSAQFQTFLVHPQIDVSVRKEKLAAIFAGKVSKHVLSLLDLLVERRREAIFPELVKAFVKMANEARNMADAIFVSAVALGSEEIKDIAGKFGNKINKALRVNNVVDPSIIGGLIIRIDDRLYDGSVKGKLSKFKQKLYGQG